jgi:hypothetical protein
MKVSKVEFFPHYLKLTIWAPGVDVLVRLREVLDEGGCEIGFEDLGAGRFWSQIYHFPAVPCWLLVAKERRGQQPFVQFEVKGEGCERLGIGRLWRLWHGLVEFRIESDVCGAWTWCCARVDLKWRGLSSTVEDVRNSARGGLFCSNSFKRDDVGFFESPTGRTVYLPGTMRRGDPCRLVRVYDRNGPVDFELELHREESKAAGVALFGADPGGWLAVARGFLLRAVDFRGLVRDGHNQSRLARPGWWDEVVGDGVKAVVEKEKRLVIENTSYGVVRRLVERAAKLLAPAVEAGSVNKEGLAEWLWEMARGVRLSPAQEKLKVALELDGRLESGGPDLPPF